MKDFYHELQEDCALIVAVLKMVCHDHLMNTHRNFEDVKPVNLTAAVQERIEVLEAEQNLQALGAVGKREFKDVFLAILHLDKLPTDVYCQIKLKDALKTIQTRTYSTSQKYHDT